MANSTAKPAATSRKSNQADITIKGTPNTINYKAYKACYPEGLMSIIAPFCFYGPNLAVCTELHGHPCVAKPNNGGREDAAFWHKN
jgi:hypothetical protein